MRNILPVASIVFAFLLTPALAQSSKEDLAAAIRKRYPDAKTEIVRTRDINGVRVHEVQVKAKDGTSTALVTDYGDFLLSGDPGKFNKLPSDARAAQGLFKSKPQDVEVFQATSYWVDMDVNGKIYRVRLDPLGRIRDIANPKEYETADVTRYEKAGKENRSDIAEMAEKHLDKPGKLRGVYRDPQMAGFYAVHFVDDQNHNQLVFLDEKDNVFAVRTEINRNDLPKPVTDAIDKLFDTGKIRQAFRGQVEYVQWTQTNAAGQAVTFKVRPNGDIMEVKSAAADRDDEAVTAAAKQKTDTDRDRENDRDRNR
jgi:hypothetical protein